MDDFGKFQPHQTADDKVVITFGLQFRFFFFKSFLGPFNNAFVVSFKLRFFKLNLFCMVDKWLCYNLHIKKKFFIVILYIGFSFLWMFSLLLTDLISHFYLTSLQLVLCRVAAVKRLPVHQP